MAWSVSDDALYGIALVAGMPLAFLLKHIGPGAPRQWLASLIGLIMVLIVCGYHFAHSFIVFLINTVIIKAIHPRRCHVWSFAWCFGYLVFFRTTEWFGIPAPRGHTNALQLFVTLRLSGLAFEIHDSHIYASSDSSNDPQMALKHKYIYVKPSVLDMFHYSYSFIGLLTGPYYKYRTYFDMIHQKLNIPTIKPSLSRLTMVPLYIAVFLVMSQFFNIKTVEKDSFYEEPLWWRLFYMVPTFTIFRMRLYIAWITAECTCMMAALGAYPVVSKPRCAQGPTDLQQLDQIEDLGRVEYNFDTIYNVDVAGVEFSPTAREAMRAWNITVQSWLALNVYKRVSLKILRNPLTMAVSAFWHGLHPGYYVSLLGIFPVVVAEKKMADILRKNATPAGQTGFDFLCWFFRMRAFEYLGMGFLLLTLQKTIRYMSSVYFIGHIVMTFFLILGFVLKPRKPRKVEEKKDQ